MPNPTITKINEAFTKHKVRFMKNTRSLRVTMGRTQEVEEESDKLWKMIYHLNEGQEQDDAKQQPSFQLDSKDNVDTMNKVIDNIALMVKGTEEERIEIIDIIENDPNESVNKDQDGMDIAELKRKEPPIIELSTAQLMKEAHMLQ